MENVRVVEGLEPFDHLDEDAPNVLLSQIGLLLLVPGDLLEQISIVCILHDDATAVSVSQTMHLRSAHALYLNMADGFSEK